MARTLDYNAVWADTTDMLRQHREAIIAIAGLLMFTPNWASGFFIGPPDMAGVKTIDDYFSAQGEHILANWWGLMPLGLLSLFGIASLLSIFLRSDLARIGDAMWFALKLLPVYILVSILTGILTSFGVFAFLFGIFYVSGRLLPVSSVVVAENKKGHGIWRNIVRGWDLTRGLGWKCFLLWAIIFLVGFISVSIINLIIGILCTGVAGTTGIPLIQTFFSAVTASVFGVVTLALKAAIYRHLQRQDA